MSTKIYNPIIKANARLLSAGRKTIHQITPESDRVAVYVYAITEYGYDILQVDERYIEDVKAAIGV